MPPSRRSRRANNVPQAPAETEFKKGDIVEFQLNGGTATGRLVKRYPRPTSDEPQYWVVKPSDRRRKNEKVNELNMSKVEEDESGGSMKRKSSRSGSSQGSKVSDDNNGKASSSSTASGSIHSKKKRKSDDISDNASSKKVTFKDEKKKKKASTAARVGTRATRNSGHELFDATKQPPPRKKTAKKIKKNEHVTVVQMLTGTLYLYRGETRRAEFIRNKY